MPHTDPRYDALRARFPDILSETEDDPALTWLVHDLDIYMRVPVPTPLPAPRQQHIGDANLAEATEPRHTDRLHSNRVSSRRTGVWLGTVAAALVVALLAGMLLTRMQMHAPLGQTNGGHGNVLPTLPAKGTCTPADIKAHPPAHAQISDLAMVSPDEGWAVGSITTAPDWVPLNTVILHYQHCVWTTVATNYPNMGLASVAMDSATDGWAVGGTLARVDGRQLALHYTNGQWQPVTLPGENSFKGVYWLVRLLSSTEGWIVVAPNKDKATQGGLTESLLHLANGRWSAVSSPLTAINDVLPVTPDETWVAGYASADESKPVLYHYQSGSWTSTSLPTGVNIDRLRMVSPNDIWASGHINAPSNFDYEQSAAVLHYDGNHWQQVNIDAGGHPQFVQAFDRNTSWAFALSSAPLQDIVSDAHYQREGKWLRVKWPFTDVSMGLVHFGMTTIQRVSPDEYWTIGFTSASQWVLLYFASGTWHAYGQ